MPKLSRKLSCPLRVYFEKCNKKTRKVQEEAEIQTQNYHLPSKEQSRQFLPSFHCWVYSQREHFSVCLFFDVKGLAEKDGRNKEEMLKGLSISSSRKKISEVKFGFTIYNVWMEKDDLWELQWSSWMQTKSSKSRKWWESPNDSQQESRCNSDGSGRGHATTHGWKCL